MKHLKKIPKFSSEDEERKFWEKRDSTAYVDFGKSTQVLFPNLKPTNRTISIRLPETLINSIKAIANRADVPYQSMMKILLDERVAQIRRERGGKQERTE